VPISNYFTGFIAVFSGFISLAESAEHEIAQGTPFYCMLAPELA
jgi:hypothetical protein